MATTLTSHLKHIAYCYFKKELRLKSNALADNVVISLTTTPIRINNIWPTINSLMLQSVKPKKIYLWIPKSYVRFPEQTINELPDFIRNNPLIQTEFITKDFGPATKLLPYLETNTQKDQKIIVVDDDRIYPKHLIKTLLHYSNLEPNAAIGIGGVAVLGKLHTQYNRTKKIAAIDILLGSQGYLIKPKFFTDEIFNYPTNLPEAFYEDDVWIGGHLIKNGIRRLIVPSYSSIQCIITHHKKTHALCRFENKDKKNFMQVFDHFKTKL